VVWRGVEWSEKVSKEKNETKHTGDQPEFEPERDLLPMLFYMSVKSLVH
jgi:hypothetical protein